jgi:myosin-1
MIGWKTLRLKNLTLHSSLQEVFPMSDVTTKKRPDTAATQFKNSLSQLMEILMNKEPSYIRCIKPNDDQKSGTYANT